MSSAGRVFLLLMFLVIDAFSYAQRLYCADNRKNMILQRLSALPGVFFCDVHDLLSEEFSSLTEIRGGSRMARRFMEERGGSEEKTATRNGGVEESGKLFLVSDTEKQNPFSP